MTRRAAILVSTNGEAFSNPSLLMQIVVYAGTNADEVFLVVGDSLNRWNLLPACNRDMEAATRRSIEGGDKWCGTFAKTIGDLLGDKFKGIYRWEEWKQNPKMSYMERRAEFSGVCVKETVINMLCGMLKAHGVDSIESLLCKADELKREKGTLLREESDWVSLPWENAMAVSILEYTLRHFAGLKVESINPKQNFLEFLSTQFFPDAYEHQAEEAVMLYRCLIPADIKFDVVYYPNKIAPIFQKAHVMFAEPEHLMFWTEIKLDSKKEDDIERVVQLYFSDIQGVSRRDKEMMAHLMKPLLAFVTTHKDPNQQNTMLMTLSGLFNIFPQFIAKFKASSSSPSFFGAPAPRKFSEKRLSERSGLSIVHSPALGVEGNMGGETSSGKNKAEECAASVSAPSSPPILTLLNP